MSHDYHKDFKFAQHYERLFSEKWSLINKKEIVWVNSKNDADYMIDGKWKMEIKIDKHKTKNFFIELISNVGYNTIGGPAQAETYGTKFFTFWFVNLKQNNLFIFDNETILNWTNKNKHNYQLKLVNNGIYKTAGIIVKRDLLKDILLYNKTLTVKEEERYGYCPIKCGDIFI